MSLSEESFTNDYEALAMAEAEENTYCGLSKEVLETMSDYSPSTDGRVPSNVDPWEWYGITPPGSPTSQMPPAFFQAEVSYEQAIVKELQDHNKELQVQLMASEGANEEMYNKMAELLTDHVMVCLERDNLRRFRAILTSIIVVLIAIVLFRVKLNYN